MVHAAHVTALEGGQKALAVDPAVHLVVVVTLIDDPAVHLEVAAQEEDLVADPVVHLAITFLDDFVVHRVVDLTEDLVAHRTTVLSVAVEALDVIILGIIFVVALHLAMIFNVACQETAQARYAAVPV